MTYFVLFVLVVWLFCTPIECWIDRHAVDLTECDEWPTHRWCAWGDITALHPSGPTISYFFLKLPSYEWRACYRTDNHRWHRRVLVKISSRAWHVQLWPV